MIIRSKILQEWLGSYHPTAVFRFTILEGFKKRKSQLQFLKLRLAKYWLLLSAFLFPFVPMAGGYQDAMNPGDAALYSSQNLLRQRRLEDAEKEILKEIRNIVSPDIKASAFIYLGYIRDIRGDRNGALDCYKKAVSLGDRSGLASFGIKKPLLWIRHIDEPLKRSLSDVAPGMPSIRTSVSRPVKELTKNEMHRSLDTLCSQVPSYYLALEEKNIPWTQLCSSSQKELEKIYDTKAFYGLLYRLVAELQDSHTYFENFPYSYLDFGVGASCFCEGDRYFVAEVAAKSPANQAGIKKGWEVLTIDGTPVGAKMIQLRPFLRGFSTETVGRNEACRQLLQSNSSNTLTLVYKEWSSQDVRSAVIPRMRISPLSIKPPSLPGKNGSVDTIEWAKHSSGACIIRFRNFEDVTDKGFNDYRHALTELGDCRGVIFDLRGNPGGYGKMPRLVISTLIQERTRVARVLRKMGPGKTVMSEETIDPHKTLHVRNVVAAVIDGTTQSSAELFATYLAYAGIPLIGAHTGGLLGGWDKILNLPCGLRLRLTCGSILRPDGIPVEGHGVVPNQEVLNSWSDLMAGNDPAMKAAIINVQMRIRL
jgi:C-terminal processing protease CtpA/Prc